MELKKVAFVTGGSRGIGAAIVKKLASEGVAVGFTYSSSQDRANQLVADIEALGGRALALKADSNQFSDIEAAITKTNQAFGTIGILVNNAAVSIRKPYDQITIEDFDHVFSVNVRSIFLAVQLVASQMKQGGRIINIGSLNSQNNPFPTNTLYVSSKAALAGLTRALARDLGPQGITINNIQPGATDTEMNPADSQAAMEYAQSIALGRYGTPDEVANMVAFIASKEASYITGATINVDGGTAI